jgi:hypothetical protein
MKNDTLNSAKSFEEVLQDPSLSRFHELINYLYNMPNKDVFPKKYEASIQNLVNQKVQTLFVENPSMPLKLVLSLVIEYLLEDLTPKLLLKMTQFTIKKWGKLTEMIVVGKPISSKAAVAV